MKMLLPLCAVVFAQCFSTAQAEEITLRTVSTQGTYDAEAVPDGADLTLGVRTFDSKLPTAVASNNDRTRAILAFTKKYGIAGPDVESSSVTVTTVYKNRPSDTIGGNIGTEFDGYLVNRTIELNLKDLSKLEALMTDLAQSSLSSIDDIAFTTSQMKSLKEEARKQAARSAHDKAELLASQLGAKLGKIRTISDDGAPINIGPTYRNLAQGLLPNLQGATNGTIGPQGSDATVISGVDAAGTIVPGKIKVSSTVDATFDLE